MKSFDEKIADAEAAFELFWMKQPPLPDYFDENLKKLLKDYSKKSFCEGAISGIDLFVQWFS